MRTIAATCVLGVVGAAGSAFGQSQTTEVKVHYTLSWQEARPGPSGTFRDGALGNMAGGIVGMLDAGEGALLAIKMVVQLPSGAPATAAGGGAGTPLHWAPSILPGSSGSGTLSAFFSGDVDLVGTNNVAGSQWSDGTTNFAAALRRKLITFTVGGGTGFVSPSGGTLADIQPAQLEPDAEALNHTNNVNCWQGLWIPPPFWVRADWNLRLGTFGILSSVAARDDQYGNGFTLPVPLTVVTTFGPGVVFIIPAPGTALAGVPVLWWGARRRRPQRAG